MFVARNDAIGPEVGFFKIMEVTGGSLYLADGITLVEPGSFIGEGYGNDGFRFLPLSNSSTNGSVVIQAAIAPTTDGLGGPLVTATVVVTPVNDAPSFQKGADIEASEDAGPQVIPGWAPAIVAGPPDELSQVVTFVVENDNSALFVQQPAITADGILSFSSAEHAFGIANVTIRLRDDGGTDNGGRDASDAIVFRIEVLPQNDAPLAIGQTLSTDEDTAKGILLTGVDVDSTVLSYLIVEPPSHGMLSGTAPNLTYTPHDNYYGSDRLTFKVSDSELESATVTVDMTILSVNDPPIVSSPIANQTAIENQEFGLTIPTGTFADPDMDGTLTLTTTLVDGSALPAWLVFDPVAQCSMARRATKMSKH